MSIYNLNSFIIIPLSLSSCRNHRFSSSIKKLKLKVCDGYTDDCVGNVFCSVQNWVLNFIAWKKWKVSHFITHIQKKKSHDDYRLLEFQFFFSIMYSCKNRFSQTIISTPLKKNYYYQYIRTINERVNFYEWLFFMGNILKQFFQQIFSQSANMTWWLSYDTRGEVSGEVTWKRRLVSSSQSDA